MGVTKHYWDQTWYRQYRAARKERNKVEKRLEQQGNIYKMRYFPGSGWSYTTRGRDLLKLARLNQRINELIWYSPDYQNVQKRFQTTQE